MPPACIRNERRDQLGIAASRRVRPVPRAAPDAPAVPSRNDRVWIPATAPTSATMIAVVGVAVGDPSAARNPASANAPIPTAPIVNDQRTAAIPSSAPIASATTRIRTSSASLSFVPNNPTTKSFAPGG